MALGPLRQGRGTRCWPKAGLVQEDAYVGDVYSLSYVDALVQIHDHHRARVSGIPALSFLVTTRVHPARVIDIREEDASVLVLRVLGHADLPNAAEALRVRVEAAQRVSGEAGSRAFTVVSPDLSGHQGSWQVTYP